MNSYESLLARIALVRRRWRAHAAVKGISLSLVSTIVLLILCVWGADLCGFKPAAVWMMRAISAAAIVFIAWRFLYFPLSARIGNVRIAQYIEENYPQLEDRLVAAVEYGKKDQQAASMVDLLIKDALDKTNRIDFSIFVKPKQLAGFGLLGIAAFVALFSLLTWGPSFFPFGFSRLYAPWTEASLGASIMIRILPGDVEIAKGSDQQVQAQLIGFDSPDVRLFMKPESSGASWISSAMEPDLQGIFRYLLIDIRSPLQYYVESKGVRSRTCSMKVIDMAIAEKIDLTYHFPAYTKMAPQVVENEGDISALKGTDVDLRIRLSRAARSARLLFDDLSTLNLSQSGSRDFSGSFPLKKSGSYVVQIAGDNGKHYPGSREYQVEALNDGAPKVVIEKPMRDVRATNVEEVFSETKADDDIGVNKLDLHYSINGSPEKMVDLYSGKAPKQSIAGTHTFFLEEFGLQPGDLISYYAKASDNNNVTGPGTASSDIYFIQVRPFEQKYVQNQQGGQQQQGAGQQGEGQDALSRQQKEIISGTFNLIREKEKMVQKEYQDGLKTLALVQSRLQTQAQNLVDRFQRRGADRADENFRKLSEYLKNAIVEMGKAAVDLGAQKPSEAMPQEQKSLQQLMRAESLFREIQVSFAQSGSGSQSSQTNAEDLADLFELELNKLKNQYETVQRGERQERDRKIDEALQRLKELAQRQQQLNERNRLTAQRGGPPPSSGSGGGQSQQQQLMDQAEQLRRQLQKLSRERSSPQLSETGDRIQKAIEEMKKALNGSQRGSQSEANAQGIRASQQLDDAARKLARGQQSGLNEGMEQAVDESKKLVREQARIQEELNRLAKNKSQSGGSSEEMKRQSEDVVDRKEMLSGRVKNLESQIQNLSQQARKTQKEAGGKLDDAANSIRDKRLPERILSGNALIQNGFYESQREREDYIRNGLEDLSRQLESARNSIGQSKEGKLEDAANRARKLAEGLESMQQRMRGLQQGRQGQQSQQAQQGQPGQGQQTQQGRQGQQGEQGQQGQQGRQGQAQGRGQQGEMQGQAQNAQGGGRNPTNLRGGFPSPDGEIRGLTGNSMGPAGPGRRDEDMRQLQSELGQRLMDAQELRRLLDRNSIQMGNLEKVIESLRRAGDYTNYNDPEQIARLKAAIDYTRKIESDLNRDLERLNQTEKYFLSEDNEAPADYRKLVEEYYKSIAKGR